MDEKLMKETYEVADEVWRESQEPRLSFDIYLVKAEWSQGGEWREGEGRQGMEDGGRMKR